MRRILDLFGADALHTLAVAESSGPLKVPTSSVTTAVCGLIATATANPPTGGGTVTIVDALLSVIASVPSTEASLRTFMERQNKPVPADADKSALAFAVQEVAQKKWQTKDAREVLETLLGTALPRASLFEALRGLMSDRAEEWIKSQMLLNVRDSLRDKSLTELLLATSSITTVMLKSWLQANRRDTGAALPAKFTSLPRAGIIDSLVSAVRAWDSRGAAGHVG
jgi:hypothetical protein